MVRLMVGQCDRQGTCQNDANGAAGGSKVCCKGVSS